MLSKNSIVAKVTLATSVASLAVAFFGAGTGTAAAASKKCLHPKKSVVTVNEYEYGFTLKPKVAHCGTITFKQMNTGSLSHNFDLENVKSGKLIGPHKKTSFTAKVGPGKYNYECDVQGHAALGMTGSLKVKD